MWAQGIWLLQNLRAWDVQVLTRSDIIYTHTKKSVQKHWDCETTLLNNWLWDTDSHQPSQNQLVAGSMSQLLEVWLSPSSWKIYYDSDETHGMPFVIWQCAEKKNKLCNDFSVGKCVNCVENILDYEDKFQQLTMLLNMAESNVPYNSEIKILTHNFSSSIKCTSFIPALTFAWSFYDIFLTRVFYLHSFSIAF